MAKVSLSRDDVLGVLDDWSDSDACGMSSGEEEALDREIEGKDDSSSNEEDDAALDQGSIALQEKAGVKSPCRKRPREGSLERGSVSRGGPHTSKGSRARGGTTRGRRARGGRARGERARGGRARGSRARGRDGRESDSTSGGTSGSETEGEEPVRETPHLGFDFPDEVNTIPPFAPHRPPGIHLETPVLRGSMTTELDFFRLFLTPQMVSAIVTHTNTYALVKVANKSYSRDYVSGDGSWAKTTVEEIYKYIALLIYFSMVRVGGDVAKYWSTKSMYHGLWARKILSRGRYKALSAFLHVVDPGNESAGDKLRKVDDLLASFKSRCKLLYQPTQKLAVDERMVKSKHRSGIRQYMKDKPTKWGVKLWVLADSDNGYTVDFNVYVGKEATKGISENGLGYDVVMKLMESFLDQGYHLYLDNFYTSPKLLHDLFLHDTPATGTVKLKRKGFPACLKKPNVWAKKHKRGDVRWVRHSPVLALQWLDSKPVSILSTLHSANDQVTCMRRTKVNGKFEKVNIPQPLSVHDYNQFMNGVDRSDQMLACHNISRKCFRWWKILFFHLVDIAVVNSFLLFQKYRQGHADVEGLRRGSGYSVVDFREALVRQINGWSEFDDPPAYEKSLPGESQFQTDHIAVASEDGTRRYCVVCYREGRGQKRVSTYCAAPQCQKFLHIQPGLNCFRTWHSPGYKRS